MYAYEINILSADRFSLNLVITLRYLRQPQPAILFPTVRNNKMVEP